MRYSLPTHAQPLKIGTGGSPLALAQAHETRKRLTRAFDLLRVAFSIEVIVTTGDRVQDRPLKELGGKGLFTREIEQGMMEGRIEIAVHSMKDMPTLQPEGLLLDTYLPREDVRDAFISLDGRAPSDLAKGSVVGTSSLQRQAHLKLRRPDLNVVEFRGNLQIRLKKLGDGLAAETFLAMAGLKRLKMDNVPKLAINVEDALPAIAQGAIGIERRADDLLAALQDNGWQRIARFRPRLIVPAKRRLPARRSWTAAGCGYAMKCRARTGPNLSMAT